MEITGTPEREKILNLQEMRLSSAKKTNKKRTLAQDELPPATVPEDADILIRKAIYRCSDPELHGKQNLLAISAHVSDHQYLSQHQDAETNFFDTKLGVCVNNDGILKAVVLKYANQNQDGQASGFGYSHVCQTSSGFKFPEDYPAKKYFRDIIFSAECSAFFIYDDKNKAVLRINWPLGIQTLPNCSDLSVEFVGELRGTVTFGNILKVSPSGSKLFGYEGGDFIRVFDLGKSQDSGANT